MKLYYLLFPIIFFTMGCAAEPVYLVYRFNFFYESSESIEKEKIILDILKDVGAMFNMSYRSNEPTNDFYLFEYDGNGKDRKTRGFYYIKKQNIRFVLREDDSDRCVLIEYFQDKLKSHDIIYEKEIDVRWGSRIF